MLPQFLKLDAEAIDWLFPLSKAPVGVMLEIHQKLKNLSGLRCRSSAGDVVLPSADGRSQLSLPLNFISAVRALDLDDE